MNKNSYRCKKPILMFVMIAIFLACISVILYVFFCTGISDRFAKFHNYVHVDFRIDGIQQNLKGIEVNYVCDAGSVVEKKSFDNRNNVRFKEGMYGGNEFEFIIPKEYFNKFKQDIKISFGRFNTNWWHVCKYSVNVKANLISEDSVNLILSQEVLYKSDGGEKRIINNDETKDITLIDNSISIYTGP